MVLLKIPKILPPIPGGDKWLSISMGEGIYFTLPDNSVGNIKYGGCKSPIKPWMSLDLIK